MNKYLISLPGKKISKTHYCMDNWDDTCNNSSVGNLLTLLTF